MGEFVLGKMRPSRKQIVVLIMLVFLVLEVQLRVSVNVRPRWLANVVVHILVWVLSLNSLVVEAWVHYCQPCDLVFLALLHGCRHLPLLVRRSRRINRFLGDLSGHGESGH